MRSVGLVNTRRGTPRRVTPSPPPPPLIFILKLMGAGCGRSSLRQLMKFGAQRGADITGEVETIHGISFVRIASHVHAAVKQETVLRPSQTNAHFTSRSVQMASGCSFGVRVPSAAENSLLATECRSAEAYPVLIAGGGEAVATVRPLPSMPPRPPHVFMM